MKNSHHVVYEGNLSDDLRSFMCTTLRQAVADNVPAAKKITKLVGFAIELLDNAQRYGDNARVEFEWKAVGNELLIEVKNISSEKNALNLQNQVDRINDLNPQEIESEYKTKLMNSDFNDDGGAGLGLLQIMKNGAKNLRINIQEMNDGAWMCVSTVLVPFTLLENKLS